MGYDEGMEKTKRRVLTRRGVVWLGQTCNQRCYFCYFAHLVANREHPLHPFMDLAKAKAICGTLRDFYGNTSVDIQGGEPTIYGDIFELVRYCREIGLYPTLITNGLVLAKPGVVERYRDAGLRDFLVSVHGVGPMHDEAVGVPGAYEKVLVALGRMAETGAPFRFNCTMSKPVVPALADVAREAERFRAYAVNYIAFNPYFTAEDCGTRSQENVPRYTEVRPRLTEALEILENAGIETNVRYLPLCMAEARWRKNFYNYQQLSYDTHEWDLQSWLWTMMQSQMMKNGVLTPTIKIGVGGRWIYLHDERVARMCEKRPGLMKLAFSAHRAAARGHESLVGLEGLYRREARVRAAKQCKYRQGEACRRCAAREICDGFHGDYASIFGMDEAQSITDSPAITDPTFYIRQQEKTVEPEDTRWAL